MAGRGEATVYESLIRLRDEERRRQRSAVAVIRGRDLPWERNPQGVMKWYVHPLMEEPVHRALTIFVQEIPPGGRSGCIRYQGGMVIYIRQGRGHTVIDGDEHYWKAGDLVQLPLRPDGVTYQHFNDDPEQAVQFIACEPNLVGALGVDRGAGFEQLEPAPA